MNLSYQEAKAISSSRIYNKLALFEKSCTHRVSDSGLQKWRIGFIILTCISVVFMGYDCQWSIPDMLGELEYYAFYFALAAFLYIERLNHVVKSTERRKKAMIIMEVAVSLNIACFLMFFIFNPIIFGKGYTDKMDFFSSTAIFLSFFSLLFHFFISDFVLLEQDWLWPCVVVLLWILINFLFNLNGITVEMKYAQTGQ